MRVLIADNDASFRTVLERQLSKWGYEVVVAADGAEAWQRLDGEDPPRLVLLDPMMPGLQGVEACRRLRGKPDGAYYYIVLLKAKGDSENMIEGINAGADDYVVKPFDEQELRVRLRAGRRIVELQEALQREASTDSLTGLRNQTAIYSILKRELQRAQRMTTPLGVAMVDIDHFKRLNDTHGHLAGDECLQEVASRLHSSLRTYDSIGRWGGEEFLIVLPGCSVDTATAIAERVRTSIADTPVRARDITATVTISAGVACWVGGPVQDPDTLIHAADQALYRAKDGGRNQVHVGEVGND